MIKFLKCIFLCSLVSHLAACGQQSSTLQEPEPVNKNQMTTDQVPAAEQVNNQVEVDDVKISIFPEQPKTGDCLKAIVTGKKGPLVFQWVVNGETLQDREGNSLCKAGLKRDDLVEVGIVGTEIFTVVTIGNTPPRILDVSVDVAAAQRRVGMSIQPKTADADGDTVELRYQWYVNGEEDLFSIGETLAPDRYSKGDSLQVKITPFDGYDEGYTFESAPFVVPNAPPMISSKPPEAFETLEYLYPVQAVDPDGDKLSYRMEQGPESMSIDETGKVSWNLTGVKPGEYPIKITVEDSDGGKVTQSFTINLGAPKQSSPLL